MARRIDTIDKVSITGIIVLASVLVLGAFFVSTNLVYALTTNTIGANVVVPSTCFMAASNSLINFGSQSPGTTSAANVITFSDSIGNAPTNVDIQGILPSGNWIGGGYSFYLANTLYGKTSGTAPTPLTTSLVDTLVLVPPGASNSLWIAVSIPAMQAAATYNSVITATSSC